MKLMKRGAVLALALVVMMSSAVRAQVLQQVPSDAMVVLKVNNLKGTSDKIATLAKDLGVAAMLPEAADPLGALQTELKVQKGINNAGELAFVYMDPAVAGRADAFLILIPVSDYKTFLTNFTGAQTTGEISSVKLGASGEPAFVANWGAYAALAPSQQLLAKKPTGLVAPSVSAKELAQKDAVLYVNFSTVRGKLLPELQKSRGAMINEIERNLNATPEVGKFGGVIKAVLNQFLNAGEEFLKDAQGASIGLSLTPAGITGTVMAEFAKDSYIAQNLVAAKNSDGPLVDGLPAGKYLFYAGSVSDSAVTGKLLNDVLDPILKEILALGPDMAPAVEYMNAIKAYASATKAQSFGMLTPSGQLGAEPIVQVIMVQKGDAKTISDSYTTMLNAQTKLMTALKLPGADATKPTIAPKAKTLDGVTFDTVTTKVDPNNQNPQAMQQAQILAMIYGAQGAVVHYGAIGTDKVLTASGVSDKMISSAITSAKGSTAPLADNENLKAVASQLPKQRVAVAYVNVGELVTSALGYAKQVGFQVPLQLPPELPPIGATVSNEEGTAFRIDVFVPTTLIQSLVAAGMQAQMQMQGGGAPAGGGL